MEKPEEEVCKQEEESLATAQTSELLEMGKEKATETNKVSFWKKTHCLSGLKNNKNISEQKFYLYSSIMY